MSTEIIGSKVKSQTGRGQNQDQTPSSTVAKTLPIIPNVAPPNASADAGDWQTRQLSPDNVPTHPAMNSAPQHALPGKATPVNPPKR